MILINIYDRYIDVKYNMIYIDIWFPKMGGSPSHHPFIDSIFPYHPAIGDPTFMESPIYPLMSTLD